MSPISYLYVNLYAMIMLLLLFFSYSRRTTDRFLKDQRIFEVMLLVNFIILFLDCGSYFFEGRAGTVYTVLNTVCAVGFHSMKPVMGILYLMYSREKTKQDGAFRLRDYRLCLIPLILNLIITVISPFYPLLFKINENNEYTTSTPLFFLSFVFSYCCILIAVVRLLYLMHRRRFDHQARRMAMHILTFPVLSIIGTVAQMFVNEIPLIWTTTTLSLLMVFLNIQNSHATTDPLTGVYSRRQLLPYLKWKTGHLANGKKLYLLVADADRFKSVNDRFGHLTGDEVLIGMAGAMRSCCEKTDFLARYGGDEFILVAERAGKNDVLLLMKLLDVAFTGVTYDNGRETLSVSVGFAEWKPGQCPEDLIASSDQRMYDEKAHRRNPEKIKG